VASSAAAHFEIVPSLLVAGFQEKLPRDTTSFLFSLVTCGLPNT